MESGKMKKVFKDRLLKLANHLKNGKLGHKKFRFVFYNGFRGRDKFKPYSCGTVGCAIGECPIVFPNQWKFDVNSEPVLRGMDYSGWDRETNSAKLFFGLDGAEANHLFQPENQVVELYGGKYLYDGATRKQVANNILAFIKIRESDG